MKKISFKVLMLLLATGIFICALPAPGQEQETVREEVKVVNVEVPVRVFYKGVPVDDLTRDDFKLYEDNKLQVINGFNVKRSKIKLQEIGLEMEEKAIRPSRYFVLVYRITQYTPSFKEGLKHIFDNILTEYDELRVFINNENLYFSNLSDKQACYTKVDRALMNESVRARQLMNAYFKQLEQQIDKTRWDMLLRELGGRGAGTGNSGDLGRRKTQTLGQFLERYLQIWKDYKKRYLQPDINSYYFFAKHLEGVRKEKWVINFYQMEMFPQISMSGEARQTIRRFISELRSSDNPEDKAFSRILDQKLTEIDRELNVAEDFPAEDISKIFYKVDAAFHSIFMRSTIGIISQDYNYKAVSTDIENSLREITKATGGSLVTTNNLVQAMDNISEKENAYYLLTYAPEDPDKTGKIKIKVSNKKYKVVYDDNMRADYINDFLNKKDKEIGLPPQAQVSASNIHITDLKFVNNELSISVGGFYMRKMPKGQSGRMEIRIRIKNIQGIDIFDQSKTLDLKKPDISITLPFKNLKRGKYDIVVDVKDMLTEKTDTKLIQPRIQ